MFESKIRLLNKLSLQCISFNSSKQSFKIENVTQGITVSGLALKSVTYYLNVQLGQKYNT